VGVERTGCGQLGIGGRRWKLCGDERSQSRRGELGSAKTFWTGRAFKLSNRPRSSTTAALLVRYTRYRISSPLSRVPHRSSPRYPSLLHWSPCLRHPGLLSSSTCQWSCSIASYCVTRVLRGFRTLRHPEVEDGGRRTAGMDSLFTVSIALF
jgi:hypothetical protein